MDSTSDCPVCASPAAPAVRYTAGEAAAYFCPPHRDADRNQRLETAIRDLWDGDTCTVHRCPSCGFGFGDPYVGGDDAFYTALHEQMAYPSWRWDYDVAVDALSSTPVARVLDVGAGSGAFLRSLPDGVERFAVESSPTTIAALAGAGVEARARLEDFGPEYDASFDAVTLFQVLEHIAPARETLRQCARLLRPGGLLVVTVPEAQAMFDQESVLGAPDMPPNHVNRWTPASLSMAVEQVGLRPEDHQAEPGGLGQVRGKVHLRILRDAQRPRSLAGLAYRVRSRAVRAGLLVAIAPLVLARLLPHTRYLLSGGAFALVAARPYADEPVPLASREFATES